jgi:hypothetical protein
MDNLTSCLFGSRLSRDDDAEVLQHVLTRKSSSLSLTVPIFLIEIRDDYFNSTSPSLTKLIKIQNHLPIPNNMTLLRDIPPAAGEAVEKAEIEKSKYWHEGEFFLLMLLSAPVVATHPNFALRCGMYALTSTLFLFLALLVYISWWPTPHEIQAERATTFAPEKVPNHIDSIVIGSGSGGSTCSNLLAQSGQKVLVLEQHPTVTGGCTHSFREQNCEWDTGLHYTSKDMSRYVVSTLMNSSFGLSF